MAAFKNPKRFLGEALNLAGESMTGNQMAKVLDQLSPRRSIKVKYLMLPRILINVLEHDIGIMANWIEGNGYGADLPKLKTLAREMDVKMTSISAWLQKKKIPLSDHEEFKPVFEEG